MMEPLFLFITSTIALAITITVYNWGVITVARRGILTELSITFLFPLCCLPFINYGEMLTDRLVIIESSFNLLIILLKTACYYNASSKVLNKINYLFAAWFVGQVGGFILAELLKGAFTNSIPSMMMGIGIFLFIKDNKNSIPFVDDKGRVLLFGADIPGYLKLMYFFWVLCVIFSEYSAILPKFIVPVIHLSSVILAMRSGEFFHARILTASHLFLINYLVHYLYDRNELGANFAILPLGGGALLLFISIMKWISVIGVAIVLVSWIVQRRINDRKKTA